MVEGPKVQLKRLRLKCLVGRLLQSIDSIGNDTGLHLGIFVGKQLSLVDSIGKEMFFIFTGEESMVMRLHFGMNGSERIGTIAGVSSSTITNNNKPYICLKFSDDRAVAFFDTTISAVAQRHYLNAVKNRDRDVMSENFMFKDAIAKISKDGRIIEETIMDQTILPGLGNIIKCESLFMSNICPDQYSCLLDKDCIMRLLQNICQFSRAWYDLTAKRRPMTYLIYGKSKCSTCMGSVHLSRKQGFGARITYSCSNCQTNGLSVTTAIRQPLRDNTNIINDENTSKYSNTLELQSTTNGIYYEDATTNDGNEENSIYLQKISERNQSFPHNTILTSTVQPSIDVGSFLRSPRCRCNSAAVLHRVRKVGPTQHRLFWSCGGKASGGNKRTQCNFFSWADNNFVHRCSRHPTECCILRRVLKPGSNNGMLFLSCRSAGCTFFEWITLAMARSWSTPLNSISSSAPNGNLPQHLRYPLQPPLCLNNSKRSLIDDEPPPHLYYNFNDNQLKNSVATLESSLHVTKKPRREEGVELTRVLHARDIEADIPL